MNNLLICHVKFYILVDYKWNKKQLYKILKYILP